VVVSSMNNRRCGKDRKLAKRVAQAAARTAARKAKWFAALTGKVSDIDPRIGKPANE